MRVRPPPTSTSLAVAEHLDPRGVGRRQPPVERVEQVAVDHRRARHEPRGIDEVAGALLVHVHGGVRERRRHVADAAGVVEVDVRDDDGAEVVGADAHRVERRQQRGHRRLAAGLDQHRGRPVDQVTGGHPLPAAEERVELVHPVADRHAHSPLHCHTPAIGFAGDVRGAPARRRGDAHGGRGRPPGRARPAPRAAGRGLGPGRDPQPQAPTQRARLLLPRRRGLLAAGRPLLQVPRTGQPVAARGRQRRPHGRRHRGPHPRRARVPRTARPGQPAHARHRPRVHPRPARRAQGGAAAPARRRGRAARAAPPRPPRPAPAHRRRDEPRQRRPRRPHPDPRRRGHRLAARRVPRVGAGARRRAVARRRARTRSPPPASTSSASCAAAVPAPTSPPSTPNRSPAPSPASPSRCSPASATRSTRRSPTPSPSPATRPRPRAARGWSSGRSAGATAATRPSAAASSPRPPPPSAPADGSTGAPARSSASARHHLRGAANRLDGVAARAARRPGAVLDVADRGARPTRRPGRRRRPGPPPGTRLVHHPHRRRPAGPVDRRRAAGTVVVSTVADGDVRSRVEDDR